MEIKRSEKLTDRRYLNLWEIEFVDRLGRPGKWQVATRRDEPKCVSGEFDLPDAVVIVPFHQGEQRLVIIREFRAALGGYQFGFPAGLVDPGESVQAAAVRELKEETGLTVVRILKTGPPLYSSSGLSDEAVAMVYVACEGTPSRLGNERSEDIETLMVSPSEAAVLCRDDSIKFDVKTWLVLSAYAENGFLGGCRPAG